MSSAWTDPDDRTWRVVGDPLVGPSGSGALDGEMVAVKDLFAVAGHQIGAGNPAWLAAAAPEEAHAPAVASLLGAGASVRGIARTDEFAYSLMGVNHHYGTPSNPRAPGRISGGSTSGPATAVAAGEVTIGLGTDTGGSVRVPAAFQGLWGFRPTHGAIPTVGVLPLAPTFDTVGLLARQHGTLRTAASVLLPEKTASAGPAVVAEALLAIADDEIGRAVRAASGHLDGTTDRVFRPPPGWLVAFQTVVGAEAWSIYGDWLGSRMESLGPDVRARFTQASMITPDAVGAARRVVDDARARIRFWLGDRILVLPTVPTAAPLIGAQTDQLRARTMALTIVAGIGGLPAVSVPVTVSSGLPVGICLVGPAGSDLALLDVAGEVDLG
nr:amidase family protein [Micromonospora sp. DSM 115978]